MAEQDEKETQTRTARDAYRMSVMDQAIADANTVQQTNLEIFDKVQSEQSLRDTIASREAKIYTDVCDMEGDNGKPKYGNDGARKAAAAQLAADDAILQTMRGDRAKADRELAVLRERVLNLTTQVNIRRAFLHGS